MKDLADSTAFSASDPVVNLTSAGRGLRDRRLEPGASYPVEVAQSLVRLGTEVDGRLARQDKAPS